MEAAVLAEVEVAVGLGGRTLERGVAQHGAVNDHALASTFENCTFVDNFAGAEGGGLLVHSGNATVTNCQFISNQVGSVVGEGAGGGVWLGRDTDATCELYPKPVFTDCVFRDNDSRNDGGGLYSLAGNYPSLVRCTFENNTAANDGGGAFDLFNALGDYVDCSFSGNRAEHYGGALYVYGGDNTLDNCTFTANTAMFKGGGIYGGGHMQGCAFTSNSGLEGGGFYGATDTVLEDCTFLQNHASAGQHAGAGFFGGPFAGAEVRGCTFQQNTTPGFGGGLLKYHQSHPMTVQGCTFIENTALGGAGMYTSGFYSDDPTVNVLNCSFFGNEAAFGGGLYLYRGLQTIVNCAFGGNSAHGGDDGATGKGGAVLSAFDDTTLINCTVYGNTADEGGGLYSQNFDDPANSGSVLIANSILWGNSDSSGSGQAAQIFNDFDSSPVVNHSCVEGWDGSLSGVGVIDQNPLFVDPDGIDNIPGTVDDNLRLTGGSPAIDAGDNSLLSPEITTDFDGGPRVINGIVDMGAYEQNLCIGQAGAIPPELEFIGDEVSVKNRFISIRLPDSSQSVAVRVLFLDLPKPFEAWNDEELWVGPPHQVSANGASLSPIPPDYQYFLAASLQCSPYYAEWPDSEFVHIYHEGIVPGGTYRIQLIDISCAATDEGNFSPAVDASASRWGDTIRDFTTIPPGPPDGAVNITDVSAIVGRFGSAPDAIAKVRADLEPGCLDLVINVSDILSSVTGFQGLDYPFEPTADSPCDSTCLSLVP